MKTGKSLVDLAAEIERQRDAKRDFIAPSDKLEITVEPIAAAPAIAPKPVRGRVVPATATTPQFKVGMQVGDNRFGINKIAHGQIAEFTGIPSRYYDRMLTEHPTLLQNNVHEWFRKYPAPRLVRTLDGNNRAFLSDRYRPLENADFAEAVLPVLLDQKLDIMSCEITEARLYIKAVHPRIHKDVPTGRKMGDGSHVFFDTMAPAIILSNSEVAYGRLSVEFGTYTSACTNLAMIAGEGMKRTHLGARHELTQNLEIKLSDRTQRLKDAALWHEVRDVVTAAFDEKRFGMLVDRIGEMAEQKITGDVPKVVEITGIKLGLSETERSGVLRHLIEGGDLTRYGLFNAFTRTAQDMDDYDRATDLEAAGGKVVELSRHDWDSAMKMAA